MSSTTKRQQSRLRLNWVKTAQQSLNNAIAEINQAFMKQKSILGGSKRQLFVGIGSIESQISKLDKYMRQIENENEQLRRLLKEVNGNTSNLKNENEQLKRMLKKMGGNLPKRVRNLRTPK